MNNLLRGQFAACHNQENWFVPLHIAVDGLSVETANWKENKLTNSIWEIVNHLIFWNERYLQRYKGIAASEEEIDNDATFRNTNESDWQSALARLDSVMTEWEKNMAEANENKLSCIHSGSNEPWWSVIANVTIHNAYHIGQIVQIRKQQGSWQPRKW